MEAIALANRLYRALAATDAPALRELLTETFQGQLTPGLPHGLGRHYDGRESMISHGWGGVARYFVMAPHPDEILVSKSSLGVRGTYVGYGRSTGKPLRAVFGHFWTFDGDQFATVTQITDTMAWHEALIPSHSP